MINLNNQLTFTYPDNYKINSVYANSEISECFADISLANSNENITKFSSYESLEGKFSFNYPSIFKVNEQDFSGGEILYHIDFSDNTSSSRGFVQVWKLNGSLEQFLNNSKHLSTQAYKYFNIKPVLINKIPGYYWDYAVLGSDNSYYKGSEVFLEKSGKLYRISYFVPEKSWNKEQENIFWDIVNSFKINQ